MHLWICQCQPVCSLGSAAAGNQGPYRQLWTLLRGILGLHLHRVWLKKIGAWSSHWSWIKPAARWSWSGRMVNGAYSLRSTTRISRSLSLSKNNRRRTRISELLSRRCRRICPLSRQARQSRLLLRRLHFWRRKMATRWTQHNRRPLIWRSGTSRRVMSAGGGVWDWGFCTLGCGDLYGGHLNVEMLGEQGHSGHLLHQLCCCSRCSTGRFRFGDGGVRERRRRRG